MSLLRTNLQCLGKNIRKTWFCIHLQKILYQKVYISLSEAIIKCIFQYFIRWPPHSKLIRCIDIFFETTILTFIWNCIIFSFVFSCRTRAGIRMLGVEENSFSNLWKTQASINPRGTVAKVTVFKKEGGLIESEDHKGWVQYLIVARVSIRENPSKISQF